MPDRSDVIYSYDGSFDGLMCCVFDSFYRRELPLLIIDENEMQNTLFEVRFVETERDKAVRVKRAIAEKISGEALAFVRNAFLTNLQDRESHILDFIYLGFKNPRQIMRMLTNDTVNILSKAVLNLAHEAELLRGFVRFSDFGGGLVAVIEPKNNVLPLLRHHFISRYPDGCFMIYDKTHSLILAARSGESRILQVDGFELPAADENEEKYRALWRRFYDTIAVEGRENPKCRMTHMPKRYWAHLTEFQDREASTASKSLSGGYALP